jgi:hypothetical protein
VFAIPNAAGTILFRGDNRGGLDPYFLNVEEGQVRFGINNSANQETLVTAPLPGLNQWIHAAGVLDTAKGTMSLYINGELVKSISTSATPLVLLDPNEEPGIGIGGHPSSFFGDFMSFDGLIDEVKLSDTALTPDQFLNARANDERAGRSSSRPPAQVAPAPALQRSPVQIARERLELADRGLKMVEERHKMGMDGGVEEAQWTRRRALAAADLPDSTERLAILEIATNEWTIKSSGCSSSIKWLLPIIPTFSPSNSTPWKSSCSLPRPVNRAEPLSMNTGSSRSSTPGRCCASGPTRSMKWNHVRATSGSRRRGTARS